ncbi:hypothetical protein [Nocardia sp. NPDC051570]|uniref:hypothetical protein n=1 Tax=Nocardia sp. NPDC051570 TaxID=3364324 RepID=UPI0037B3E196
MLATYPAVLVLLGLVHPGWFAWALAGNSLGADVISVRPETTDRDATMVHARSVGTALAIVAVIGAALLSSCGQQAKEIVNKGGDTPCNEFIGQDSDTQHITVRKYLNEQRATTTASVDDRTVDQAIGVIDLMCRGQANPKTPIRNADLTGILVPK